MGITTCRRGSAGAPSPMASRSSADKLKPLPPDPDRHHQHSAIPRAEVRETAGAFLDGLLSGVARKTGWLLAEQAGLDRPYRMQSLLGRSRWDADALRDRIRADVIEALGD